MDIKGNLSSCPNTSIKSLAPMRIITGQYLFPPLFVVGVIGNVLNLLVLNSRGMRNRTNALLSALTLADLLFFFFLLPSELIAFESNHRSHSYMTFFIYTRMPFTTMANFFATTSTWLAMVVTGERLMVIKMPLHAKFYFTLRKTMTTILIVYAGSFALNAYGFFWLSPVIISFCNNTKFDYQLAWVNKTVAPNLHRYVKVSLLVSPFFMVYIPLMVLIVLNSYLLYYLRQSRKDVIITGNSIRTEQNKNNERKIAFMVAVIVLSFIVLSTPSAVLHLHEWFRQYVTLHPRTEAFLYASTFANLLVVLNKATNFVLYCAASSKFRHRLLKVMCRERSSNVAHSNRTSTHRKTTITSLSTHIQDIFRRLSKGTSSPEESPLYDFAKYHKKKGKKRRYTDPMDLKMNLLNETLLHKRYSQPQ